MHNYKNRNFCFNFVYMLGLKVVKIFPYILSLCFVALLSVSLSVAQDMPPLASDPAVLQGKLPDNIDYYIVTNPTVEGSADLALVWRLGMPAVRDTVHGTAPAASLSGNEALQVARRYLAGSGLFSSRTPDSFLRDNGVQGTDCGYIELKDDALAIRFRDCNVNRGDMFLDSLLLLAFDMTREYSSSVRNSGAADCGQAIIISGDLDRNAVLSKMKMLSMYIPDIDPAEPADNYRWYPGDSLRCMSLAMPFSRTVSVIAEYSLPRIPREYMGSALPAVYEQMGGELGLILKRRLYKEFSSARIPVSGIQYGFRGSSSGSGDELYTVRVTTSEDYVNKVIPAISSVLYGLAENGVTVKEYAAARKVVGRILERKAGLFVKSNKDNTDRCIASYLYGASVASPAEKYSFFEASGLSDSSGTGFFNRFVTSMIGSTENLSLVCISDSSVISDRQMRDLFLQSWKAHVPATYFSDREISTGDTSRFDIAPGKCKIRRTRKETVSGGSFWIFANGMRVVYKQVPTGGRFWYSLILKGGFSSLPGIRQGQGAFFSDIADLYSVCGMNHDDLDYLLSEKDIVMRKDVGPMDMRISGSAASGSLTFLLKAISCMAQENSVDSTAFDYYIRCEKLRLAEKAGFEERLAAIDSIFCPDSRFSVMKTSESLSPDLLNEADRYFRTQFSKLNDGVFLLVGDMDEYSVRKILQEYIGSFPVTGKMCAVGNPGTRTVSGESTYIVSGPKRSLDVVMSAPVQLSVQNYMAAEIASMAIKDELTSSLSGMAASLRFRRNFTSVTSESFNVAVSVEACDTSGFAMGVEPFRPVKVLFSVRSVLNDLAGRNIAPEKINVYKTTLENTIAARQNDPEYWIETLTRRFTYGKDYQTGYSEKIDAVTPDMVREIIYSLDNGAKVEYIVRPKRK